MPLRPKRTIESLKACAHGGINSSELRTRGISPDEIMDFSVSINPFMPPPGTGEILRQAAINKYPDSEATELREKLAGKLGVPVEKILAGNGTTELIRLIALTYIRRGDRVLIPEPTYGEYEPACQISGARIIRHRAREEDGFRPRTEEIIELVREYHPRVVFICNPGNPTGTYLQKKDITGIMGAMGEGLLILDEAYTAFVEKRWDSLELTKKDNVVILRSMTKDYGIPGLRLGYAVGEKEIIDYLRLVAPPWNVNGAAQQVGLTLLDEDEYMEKTLLQVREAKRYLEKELRDSGLRVLPSDANYFLVKVGNAKEFRDSLLKHGIQVRDCTSFGLPEYVRIAPRTIPECRRLIEAVKAIQEATGEKDKRL